MSLGAASAQQREISIAASSDLAKSGLLDYLYPRFSFKHNVRILRATLGAPDATRPHLRFGPSDTVVDGVPVLTSGEIVYKLEIVELDTDAAHAKDANKFLDWLMSDVGRNTLEDFKGDDGSAFRQFVAPVETRAPERTIVDISTGQEASLKHCGRCHVVGEINYMKGIGSTPSFNMLRTLADWEYRFRNFHLLRPHPAFTQIVGVTPPFSKRHPPSLVPIELTPEELEAIVGFVATVKPAELGQPVSMSDATGGGG